MTIFPCINNQGPQQVNTGYQIVCHQINIILGRTYRAHCMHQQRKFLPLKKSNIYKKGTKPFYEVSNDTNTDHYFGDKETGHNEDKE